MSTHSTSKAWPPMIALNVLILQPNQTTAMCVPSLASFALLPSNCLCSSEFAFVLLSCYLFYRSYRNYCSDPTHDPPSTPDSQLVIASSPPKLHTCTPRSLSDTPPSGQFIPNVTKFSSFFSSRPRPMIYTQFQWKTLAFFSYKRGDCKSPSKPFPPLPPVAN